MRPVRICIRQCVCLPLVALLLAACAALQPYAEPPRVSLVSIRPLDMQMLEQRYALRIRILNPNRVELPVAGLSYTLEVNGREFAYGVSQQAVTIPPYGEAVLDVELVSNLLDLLRQIDRSQDGGLAYRLHGRLGLSGRRTGLAFDYSGELRYLEAEPPAGAGLE